MLPAHREPPAVRAVVVLPVLLAMLALLAYFYYIFSLRIYIVHVLCTVTLNKLLLIYLTHL